MSASTTRESKRAARPTRAPGSGWFAAGAISAALGISLALVPRVLGTSTPWLQPLRGLGALTLALVVGGSIFVALGVLRRALWGVRRSLETLAKETSRLDQIAADGRKLRSAVDAVQEANKSLKDDVGGVQLRLRRLSQLATNSEQAVSNFRLAASVDQLGKRLDVVIKDQLESVQQRLSTAGERSEKAILAVTARLKELDALIAERHESERRELRVALEEIQARSSQAHSELEQSLQATARVEAQVASCQNAVTTGLEAAAERSTLFARELTSGLDDLRGELERELREQSQSVGARLGQLDGRIERAELERASAIKQLAKSLEERLAGLSEESQRQLSSVAEQAQLGSREIVEELAQLGTRLGDQARSQGASLQQALERAAETSAAENLALEGHVERLGERLDALAQSQRTALQQALERAAEQAAAGNVALEGNVERLGERLDALAQSQRTTLQQALERAAEQTAAGNVALEGNVERLGERLDELAQSQRAAVQHALEQAVERAAAGNVALDGNIERLGERLDELAQAQRAAVREALEQAAEQAAAGNVALEGNVERLGERLDELVQTQRAALQHALEQAAEQAMAGYVALEGNVERLGERLDALAQSQRATLQQALERVAEQAATGSVALEGNVERLGERLDELAQTQRAALQQALDQAAEHVAVAHCTLNASLEQIGLRTERTLDAHFGLLESVETSIEKLAAGIVASAPSERREPVNGASAPTDPTLSEIEAKTELPGDPQAHSDSAVDGALAYSERESAGPSDVHGDIGDGSSQPQAALPRKREAPTNNPIPWGWMD